MLKRFALTLPLLILLTGCSFGNFSTSKTSTASTGAIPKILNCGQISVTNSTTTSSSLTPENCFAQAFAKCALATLTVKFSNTNLDETATYSTQKIGSVCRVSVNSVKTLKAVKTNDKLLYTCDSLVQNSSGLTIKGCGLNDIQIPAPNS